MAVENFSSTPLLPCFMFMFIYQKVVLAAAEFIKNILKSIPNTPHLPVYLRSPWSKFETIEGHLIQKSNYLALVYHGKGIAASHNPHCTDHYTNACLYIG